jgi:uncharacterized caspase-like protein
MFTRWRAAAALAAGLLLTIPWAASSQARRVALVIGNAAYRRLPVLRNPVNDAADMAEKLKALGFDVSLVTDATQQAMEAAVRQFGARLAGSDAGLFYYSGHGVQSNGENYLVPVDADVGAETDLRYKTVQADFVLDYMKRAGSKLNIVILDACRDNPFSTFRSASRGLAVVSAPTGSIVVYATSPGSVAEDGSGRNGTFTASLLKRIGTPGQDLKQMLDDVGKDVQGSTAGRQVPWVLSSYFGSFQFAAVDSAMKTQKGYGTLEVDVYAGARVLVDGADKGELAAGAVGTIPGVEAGSRVVEARYADGQTETRTVFVERDKTTAVRFSHGATGAGGETAAAAAHGIIAMDWLPVGSSVSLDGTALSIPVASVSPFRIENLDPKDYALAVSIPDAGVYSRPVAVHPGETSLVPRPGDFLLAGYRDTRARTATRLDTARVLKTSGWISLGAGGAGAAAAVASWFLGKAAYAAYEAATASADAASYRSTTEAYSGAFVGSCIAGGVGLIGGLLLELLSPAPAPLQDKLTQLDAEIGALSGGEAGQ